MLMVFNLQYFQSTGPQIALYDTLNVQIKSYNFTVLESFSSYIHKTAENMGIEVEDWWEIKPLINLSIWMYLLVL